MSLNRIQRVVGVNYELGEAAPTVMLKAAGEPAELLLQDAVRDNIPIVRDTTLTDQLYRVPIDGAVGPELFPVMAILLAHVMKVDLEYQEKKP